MAAAVMLLFRLLKLFGFDLRARIDEFRAQVERRVQQATDQAKQVAMQAAVTAALLVVAAFTALAAIAIGLVALHRWAAESYGIYAGYAVVGGLLGLVAVILAGVAWARSLPSEQTKDVAERAMGDLDRVPHALKAQASPAVSGSPSLPAAVSAKDDTRSSPRVWIELLTLLVPVLIKSARGSGLAGGLIGKRSEGARGAGDALEGAASIVREGDRLNLLAVLAGAAFLGWLMGRQFRR